MQDDLQYEYSWSAMDSAWMEHACRLAQLGRGTVDPNPMVGAVLVRDGICVGEGWHSRAGEPHAEVFAVEKAGELTQGSTLYVNLEPCIHVGRTPACAPMLLQAGVKQVMVGMVDPDPRVAGQGISFLREQGILVVVAPEEWQIRCALENSRFAISTHYRRAAVTLKYSMSLDGKIATASGDSKWISNEESRERVHLERSLHQAILVGRATVQRDDPHLNVRGFTNARQPVRIVLDSRGSVSPNARIFDSAGGPVVICTTPRSSEDWRKAILDRGADVRVFECDDSGRVPLPELLSRLHERGIRSVLVEGGSEIHGSFVQQGVADRLLAFVCPLIIGGHKAYPAVGGVGAKTVADAQSLQHLTTETYGPDVLFDGYFRDDWIRLESS
jgi:diaminohydroxyphosphoribosylaminopyrimidine deaminase / 5-amino-6-(5-phosphoribosylamino)uracil reductase